MNTALNAAILAGSIESNHYHSSSSIDITNGVIVYFAIAFCLWIIFAVIQIVKYRNEDYADFGDLCGLFCISLLVSCVWPIAILIGFVCGIAILIKEGLSGAWEEFREYMCFKE